MLRKPWNRHLPILLGMACLVGAQSSLAIEYANIDIVDGVDPIADAPTVSIPSGQRTANFNLEAGPITGLFPVRFSADATTDAANGVLLGYVRENGRDQLDSMGASETLYATSASSRRGDGSFSLTSRRAGDITPDPDSLYVSGAPFNANLAAAYFPFSEGWMGGTAYNSADGLALNELVASPGLSIGVAPPANFVQDFYGVGDNLVTLPGVTDTRRQGLLFVGGGKNEDNYAISEPTADGSGFNLTLRDNGSGSSNGEVDPVSFVFIPMGTPNVTMARINGRGHGQNPEPFAMISSGGDFTVTGGVPKSAAPGEYRLSIAGQTPSTGTLLVSPSGTNDGANGYNGDNVVTYQADGDDWVILVQDSPALTGAGQGTDGGRLESAFSFAFLPFDAPVTAPGPIPAVETLTNFSKQRTIAWNTDVVDVNGGNTFGDMYLEIAEATSDVTVLPALQNLGDNAFMVDGAFFGKSDGVLFVTVSEGLRDNSATGGAFEYGIASADADNDDEWAVHTAAADPMLSEHNINFASAFFGADTGFTMAQDVATDGPTAMADVTIGGVDSQTDGVLIVNAAGNDDNFVTSTPREDGSGWDVTLFDNGLNLEGGGSGNRVNYIFLPFEADNLIAGLVSEDGSIDASTDTNDFSLTRDAEGEYLLTIPGKTPEDGMLLLTSTGEGDSADNALAYETAGSSFRILGLDMVTDAESALGSLVSPEDTSFSFAYIDFENPASLSVGGLAGDYNGDGLVNAADYTVWRDTESTNVTPGSGADGNGDGFIDGSDYTVWVNNFGSSNTVATSVPEPGAIALLVLALGFSSASARPARKS